MQAQIIGTGPSPQIQQAQYATPLPVLCTHVMCACGLMAEGSNAVLARLTTRARLLGRQAGQSETSPEMCAAGAASNLEWLAAVGW